MENFRSLGTKVPGTFVVLLRWQEFATRSVAVFCLTYHRGGGGEYRCSMDHALRVRVNHLSRSLPSRLIMPHVSTAEVAVNNTTT